MKSATLLIPSKNKTISLYNRSTFSVGSDPNSDYRLDGLPKAQKTLFRITSKSSANSKDSELCEYFLLNLGPNTLVNNNIVRKLSKVKLRNRDVIKIDDLLEFKFLIKSVITPLSKLKSFNSNNKSGKIDKHSPCKNKTPPMSTLKYSAKNNTKVLSSIKSKYTAFKKDRSSTNNKSNNNTQSPLKLSPTLNSINFEKSVIQSTPNKQEKSVQKTSAIAKNDKTPGADSIQIISIKQSPFINQKKNLADQMKQNNKSAPKQKSNDLDMSVLSHESDFDETYQNNKNNLSKLKIDSNISTKQKAIEKRYSARTDSRDNPLQKPATETKMSNEVRTSNKCSAKKQNINKYHGKTKSPIVLKTENLDKIETNYSNHQDTIKEEQKEKQLWNVDSQLIDIYNDPLIASHNKSDHSVIIIDKKSTASNQPYMRSSILNVHLNGVLNKPLSEITQDSASIEPSLDYSDVNKILSLELIKSIISNNTNEEDKKITFMDLMIYVKHFCRIQNDYKIGKVLIIQLERAVLNGSIEFDQDGMISIKHIPNADSQIMQEISIDLNNPLNSKKRKVELFEN